MPCGHILQLTGLTTMARAAFAALRSGLADLNKITQNGAWQRAA